MTTFTEMMVSISIGQAIISDIYGIDIFEIQQMDNREMESLIYSNEDFFEGRG